MNNNEIVKYELANPEQAMKVAEILQKFVKEKKLTANIKGKEYPLVESWLFAGSQLGLYPLLTEIKELSTGQEIKYMATVEVRKLSDDKIMSRGIAVCSNKEASKRLFDEYAILSMAQTRAEGKAFRMLLSWIMKAAGFEATPAEEMDFAKTQSAEFTEDMPTPLEKQLLKSLLMTSDLDEEERELAMEKIDTCIDYKVFEKIQHRLESRQRAIDTLTNPMQGDINKHLKKSIKA